MDDLKKLIQKKDDENKKLQGKINEFQNDMNEMKQRSRMINVIVNGIPQKKNEDMMKLVEMIGQKLGINDPLHDVQRAHRVNSTNKNKPKPIVIRLLNTKTRDRWTAAYRQRKLWNEKWYVNEHLTKTNQDLLYKTKEWAKKNNYKFVWTRDCKVHLRKDENSRVFAVNNLEHLESIQKVKKPVKTPKPNELENLLSDEDEAFFDTVSKNSKNLVSSSYSE
ncbi:hypothetical protein WDU94_010692 [Cyamophila willieti]